MLHFMCQTAVDNGLIFKTLAWQQKVNYNLYYILQTYLTEDDFLIVFGINVHDYKALPKWKQDKLKKRVDLF